MDAELIDNVRAAQAGDLDAFCYAVTATRGAALGAARAILGDSHAAEDAAQDAYLVALRRLGELRDPAAFSAWLRTLVRTQALRAARRREATPSLEASEPAAVPAEDRLERAEQLARIQGAVRGLDPRRQAVVEGYYLRGLSVEDTACELGLPPGTVKRLLHEARERLRPRLVGLGFGPAPLSVPSPASSSATPQRLRLPL